MRVNPRGGTPAFAAVSAGLARIVRQSMAG
jgi:hypothetical protein